MKLKQNYELKNECLPMPKLRTFNLFKDFENQPSYLTKPLTFYERKSLANLRSGSFKIRVETQRYFRPKIPYEQRFCVTCSNEKYEIECESHFLFSCTSYSDLRHAWLLRLEIPDNFDLLSLEEKLKLVLNHPTNIKPTAKFIIDAFNARSKFFF